MSSEPALSDGMAILYVRIAAETKRQLRALAKREFGGSMAAAIRYLLEAKVSGTQGRASRK